MSRHIVVMGVSGCGKTTLARALATQLGWAFAEGDDFHPSANVAKMRGGIPLTDADRWPWLESLRDWMTEQERQGRDTVLSCSALKKIYRDLLRGAGGEVRFIYLAGTPALLEERLSARAGHFMPAGLLASQLATLEPPDASDMTAKNSLGIQTVFPSGTSRRKHGFGWSEAHSSSFLRCAKYNPKPYEQALTLDIAAPPEELVQRALGWVAALRASHKRE